MQKFGTQEHEYVIYLKHQCTNILMYLTFTIGRSYVFKDCSLYFYIVLFFYNKSQNIKELIYQAYILLVIIVINLVRSCLFILSIYLAQLLSVEVLYTLPYVTELYRRGLYRRAPCSRVYFAYSLRQLRVGISPSLRP